ncbi:hypothetical protein J6590_089302 [Homalodisca vitripennis]|nr:hypothetical protein J6590_089302 [Homalodisca vitripennis]
MALNVSHVLIDCRLYAGQRRAHRLPGRLDELLGTLEVQSETREVVQSTAVKRDINLPSTSTETPLPSTSTSTETPTRNLSSHNKCTTMVTPEGLQ